MKKNLRNVLSLVLAMVMVMSMTACFADTPDTTPGTTVDTTPGTTADTTPATTEGTEPSTEATEPSTEATEPDATSPEMNPDDTLPTEPENTTVPETQPRETEPEETTPPETGPKETEPKESEPKESEPKETEVTWTEVNEIVYATGKVNVRKGAGSSYEKLGSLNKGDSVTRTAIGSNGWSRIVFQDMVAYVSSSYLTTTKPTEEQPTEPSEPKETEPKETEPEETEPQVTWTEVNETVYAALKASMYAEVGGASLFQVDRGTEMTRIAFGSNGWSKVMYNGSVYYCKSAALTYEGMTEEEKKKDEDTENGIVYCSKCGKLSGHDGRDGKCVRHLMVDWTCPDCGTFVPCGECHTCPDGTESNDPNSIDFRHDHDTVISTCTDKKHLVRV